jgi:hypothetical protein
MAIHLGPIISNLGKLLLKYDHLNPFEFHVAMQLLYFILFFLCFHLVFNNSSLFMSMSNLI